MADEFGYLPGYLEAKFVFISPSIFPDLSRNTTALTDAVISSEVAQQVWGKIPKHRLVLACKSISDIVSSAASGNDFVLNVCAIPRLAEEIERVYSQYDSTVYMEMKQGLSTENENVLVVFVSENLKRTITMKGEVFKLENFSNLKLTALVRKITPLPLAKVVLGAKTEESYHWANSELHLFLADNISNSFSVLREGELLPSWKGPAVEFSALHIMHCEPLIQGIITPRTCVVVSQMFNRTSETEKLTQNDIAKMKTIHFPDIPDINSLLVSDFTNVLTDCPIQTRGSDLFKAPATKIASDYPLRCLKLGVYLPSQPGIDLQSQGFVSLETLFLLNIFHGRWVQIWMQQPNCTEEEMKCVTTAYEGKYQCNELDVKMQDQQHYSPVSETERKICHVIQLCCNESKTFDSISVPEFMPVSCQSGKLNNNMLYISPLLYFNLTGCCYQTTHRIPVDVSVQPITEDPDEEQEEGKHLSTISRSSVYKPPFAGEAHVALVASHHVKSSDSFDVQLMSHFSIPRLLTVGDVFLVKYDWRKGGDDKDSPEDLKPREVTVYFKVTKLSYKGDDRTSCFVDSEHSSLYQKGVVHSYIPALLSDSRNNCSSWKWMQRCSPRSFWHTSYLPGLQLQVDLLEKLIKPYLENRKNTLCPSGILVTGPLRVGKTSVVMASSRRLNLHVLESNCYDLCGESVAAMEARIRNLFQKAASCSPCILLLRNIHALGKDREGNDDEPRVAITIQDSISSLSKHSDWPVVTIATSSSPKDISPDMFSCFLHEVTIDTPSEEERCDMLMSVTSMIHMANDVSIKQLARKTAGFVLGDFVALLSQAAREATKNTVAYYEEEGVLEKQVQEPMEPAVEGAVRQLGPEDSALQSGGFTTYSSNVRPTEKVNGVPVYQFPLYTKLEADICSSGVKIHTCDVEKALESLQASQSDAIGAPKIPSVKWEDVGGLVDVKADILDTIQLPLQHPELFAAGLRRSGVLLYGPPGTGKTLLAKAVATECSLNFLSVKGPELINMYVGQSEQNVREVFARAQSASPCVIFFDELDSLAPNRGRSGDSGGVMDRVVSQLLAELDGLRKSCDVFVIGATNRPDLLDPALLRPGRFDKMLYLGVSKDHESQLKILKALTRKFNVDPRFILETFSRQCPLNLTGADLYALCSDAMLQAIKRNIARLEQGDAERNESDIQVGEKDFLLALENLVPSVSFEELRRFEVLQQQFALSK